MGMKSTRHHDLRELDRALQDGETVLKRLRRDLEEAAGAGVLRSPSLDAIRSGTSKPTEQALTSYERIRMESVGEYVDRRLVRARKQVTAGVAKLEEAVVAIHEAWLDLDPDLAPDRKAKRETKREQRESYGAMWAKETAEGQGA